MPKKYIQRSRVLILKIFPPKTFHFVDEIPVVDLTSEKS